MCTYKTNIDHFYFELNQSYKSIIISLDVENKSLVTNSVNTIKCFLNICE